MKYTGLHLRATIDSVEHCKAYTSEAQDFIDHIRVSSSVKKVVDIHLLFVVHRFSRYPS